MHIPLAHNNRSETTFATPKLTFKLLLVESVANLVDGGALDLHRVAHVALMVLAVDVVEIVDGVFEDAVADVAVKASGVGGGRRFVDYYLFIDFAFQIDLKVVV